MDGWVDLACNVESVRLRLVNFREGSGKNPVNLLADIDFIALSSYYLRGYFYFSGKEVFFISLCTNMLIFSIVVVVQSCPGLTDPDRLHCTF